MWVSKYIQSEYFQKIEKNPKCHKSDMMEGGEVEIQKFHSDHKL